ncbi:Exodeoxyribonuclease VII large subunit protein [Minicystis rosea]|nr:Exodeoxyribonuclease VII large subunit protein [Minicystis rosea]
MSAAARARAIVAEAKAASAVPAPEPEAGPPVISVGELDRRLKRLLEGNTADVHVEGEISGLKEPASGHMYFTLKDEGEDAAIECVMYRTAPARSRKLLAEGARVVLIGRATVYAPRGRLQFTAEQARPAGRGALLEALERLKEKLAGEGLFAADRKRPLPAEPKVIGVVTSGDGAAIHDIIKVAFRRGPVRILLARAPVQGAGAGERLARALLMLSRVPEVEAIILGRGGGSADDLAAFNDEGLVRQVAASRVPVVSAVGHEIDVSLTDLAADARASTPSQAAELLVPDAEARAAAITHLRARMARAMRQEIMAARTTLERQATRLGTPERLLAEHRQRLDEASMRLGAAMRRRTSEGHDQVARLERRLIARHPSAVLAGARAAIAPLKVRLAAAMRARLATLGEELGGAAARLDAMSPLSVLARGYAIVTGPNGRAVTDAAEVRPGDALRVRVHRGTVDAMVVAGAESRRTDEGKAR